MSMVDLRTNSSVSNGATRLELTWVGKRDRPRLEPRILIEDAELSYHAEKAGDDKGGNVIVHGDNLLALRALRPDFEGRIKCIYIDPPYNTGADFDHYVDGLEHSTWLSLMRNRIEELHKLLRDDGSLWISIDDNELHYLKVLCDEIFGRANHVATIVASMNPKGRQLSRYFAGVHEYVLCFAKDIQKCSIRAESSDDVHESDFPFQDASGRYRLLPLRNTNKLFHPGTRPNLHYPIYYSPSDLALSLEESPERLPIKPEFGDGSPAVWRWGKEKAARDIDQICVKKVRRLGQYIFDIFQKDYLVDGRTKKIQSLWLPASIGSSDEAKREVKAIVPDDVFGTPKPERLIKRILDVATSPGDWVLDSFAGSGTTGAVAHKMARRWILVELGDQCFTHVLPRLRKVVDGDDPGGVTGSVGWSGGGGFRFYRLAASLLEKDHWGNWVIGAAYNREMLAEAVCKLEGFHYAPDSEIFWIHGKSTERDFIYVTTQNLSREQLQFISAQVGSERSVLVCCAAFRANGDEFSNLTMKKIPQAVLGRCEWGRDDYCLNVEDLPSLQVFDEQKASESAKDDGTTTKRAGRRRKASATPEFPLFAAVENGEKRK